jgi:hypothetical protein
MHGLRSMTRWFALVLLGAPAYAQCCQNSLAVIASLSGKAAVLARGSRAITAAAALDWLVDGDTLEVAPHSQAVLILWNGHRYELDGGAKLTVGSSAAPKISGAARELPALPPIPRTASIAAASAPTPGALRIRGGGAEMSELYPRAGTVALPDKVTLRYKAVPDAISYRITLEDDAGNALWNGTTEATKIPVPSGTVKAGTHYFWRVRALRAGIEIGAGTQEFNTLSAEGSLQRTKFASAARASGDDLATLALLADVDLQLGLIAEGCDELSAAIKQKPGAALQHAAAVCKPGPDIK